MSDNHQQKADSMKFLLDCAEKIVVAQKSMPMSSIADADETYIDQYLHGTLPEDELFVKRRALYRLLLALSEHPVISRETVLAWYDLTQGVIYGQWS